MALQAQQIVALACAIAKTPGMLSIAGQMLNSILEELAETYDFDIQKKTFNFTFNSASGTGSGPYTLPADYLRAAVDECIYTIQGVPYNLVPVDISEYENFIQQAGLAGMPSRFATDMSTTPGKAFFWPPPSGAFPVMLRYYATSGDIPTPESSAVVPWFPNRTYLFTRLAGELMKVSDDSRASGFLGEGPDGAQGILNRYLKLKDDKSNRSETVKLDRRRFGSSDRLKNTKTIGW